MPKHSKTLHLEFIRKIKELDETRSRFEAAHANGIVTDIDIVQAYAGLYLDLFTEFEALIENLFLGLLSGSVSHGDRLVKRKVKIKPVSEIENVVRGEKRRYLDWLPYKENTVERAKIYFNNGIPFSRLDQIDKDRIHNYQVIRNAIAHKSKKADNAFKQVIEGLTLSPVEETPSGYLRNIPNPSSGHTQLEIIAIYLTTVSNKLCNRVATNSRLN